MTRSPPSERYDDPTVCIDCDHYRRSTIENPGRVMRRQVTSGALLPLCPEHADRRRASGTQTHGSKPPRRLQR